MRDHIFYSKKDQLMEDVMSILGSKPKSNLEESVNKAMFIGASGSEPENSEDGYDYSKASQLEVLNKGQMVNFTEKETGLVWAVTNSVAKKVAAKLSEVLITEQSLDITIANGRTKLKVSTFPDKWNDYEIPDSCLALINHDSDYNGIFGVYPLNKEQTNLFISILSPEMKI